MPDTLQPHSSPWDTAIVVYDYLLGIGKEVDLVWGSEFSSGTLIYLVNQY